MTKKIKIEELCKRLNSNEEEKWAFLNGLTNPQFLESFYKYDVLRFNDSCFYPAIQYLITVFDTNIKLVSQVINKNIKENTMPSNGGFVFRDLLKKFTLSEVEKYLEYERLFDFQDSIYICASFLNRNDLANFPKIYLACIKNLIKYKTVEEKVVTSKKFPELFHKQYFFQKVFLAPNQLKEILKKHDCYELLKEEYRKLHGEFGDLSVYSKQYIDPEEVIINEYKSKDVRDIILTFMAIYLKAHADKNEVEKLLKSDISMFVKLGLYVIGTNLARYKNLFNEFLTNHKDVNGLYQYKYEILTIFEELQKFYDSAIECNDSGLSPYKELEATITSFFDSIPQANAREKYLFLHGLKTHPEFSKMFNEMKKEFGNREIYNPKLFISEIEVCSVYNVSFISIQKLGEKSIEEQVEYWNGASKLTCREIKREKGAVYEENFDGLIEDTRKLIGENVKDYLKQIKKLYDLRDIRVISAFWEIFSKKIREKVITKISFNKIINLIEYYLQNYEIDDNYDFDFELSELLKSMIIKSGEGNFELHSKISTILQTLITRNYDEKDNGGDDISFYSINTVAGRYWECFITLLDYKKSMTDDEKAFLEKSLFKRKNYNYSEKMMLFHLGVHMNAMIFRLKEYPWVQNITERLQDNIPGCAAFLQGFFSYVTYIEAFKSFEKFILENYSKISLPSDVYRRFIGLFCDIKFKNTFNESDLIKNLETVFKAEEYSTMLDILALETKPTKYDKARVLSFWKEQIDRKIGFSDSLVEIPNRYMLKEDLLGFDKYLIKMFKLAANSNVKDLLPFYLEKFLNNLLSLLKKTNDEMDLAKIFNILSALIPAITYYEYKGSIPESLKFILEEYRKKNTDKAKDNVAILANQICGTKGLIQYSNLFTEFFEEIG